GLIAVIERAQLHLTPPNAALGIELIEVQLGTLRKLRPQLRRGAAERTRLAQHNRPAGFLRQTEPAPAAQRCSRSSRGHPLTTIPFHWFVLYCSHSLVAYGFLFWAFFSHLGLRARHGVAANARQIIDAHADFNPAIFQWYVSVCGER